MINFSQKIQKNDLFFGAILVSCVLIISESVWVVERFARTTKFPAATPKVKELLAPTKKVNEIETWVEGPKDLKVNELAEVKVGLTGLQSTKIIGTDLVLFYDPKLIKIVDQNATKAGVQVKTSQTPLGEIARNLVEEEKGRIVISLLNLDKNGALVKKGDKITLAQISFLPKAEGNLGLTFKLTTLDEPGTKVTKPTGEANLAVIVTRNYQASVTKAPGNLKK